MVAVDYTSVAVDSRDLGAVEFRQRASLADLFALPYSSMHFSGSAERQEAYCVGDLMCSFRAGY